MLPNEFDIALLPQLLRVRRFVADHPQTRNAAAFLIDGDDRFDLADGAEIVDQLAQLRRTLDVSREKNKTARLHPLKQVGRLAIEFGAGDASENELA